MAPVLAIVNAVISGVSVAVSLIGALSKLFSDSSKAIETVSESIRPLFEEVRMTVRALQTKEAVELESKLMTMKHDIEESIKQTMNDKQERASASFEQTLAVVKSKNFKGEEIKSVSIICYILKRDVVKITIQFVEKKRSKGICVVDYTTNYEELKGVIDETRDKVEAGMGVKMTVEFGTNDMSTILLISECFKCRCVLITSEKSELKKGLISVKVAGLASEEDIVVNSIRRYNYDQYYIVGRPGLGKSTLVNAIIGKEAAVIGEVGTGTIEVEDYEAKINGKDVIIYDTQGISDSVVNDSTSTIMELILANVALNGIIMIIEGNRFVDCEKSLISKIKKNVGVEVKGRLLIGVITEEDNWEAKLSQVNRELINLEFKVEDYKVVRINRFTEREIKTMVTRGEKINREAVESIVKEMDNMVRVTCQGLDEKLEMLRLLAGDDTFMRQEILRELSEKTKMAKNEILYRMTINDEVMLRKYLTGMDQLIVLSLKKGYLKWRWFKWFFTAGTREDYYSQHMTMAIYDNDVFKAIASKMQDRAGIISEIENILNEGKAIIRLKREAKVFGGARSEILEVVNVKEQIDARMSVLISEYKASLTELAKSARKTQRSADRHDVVVVAGLDDDMEEVRLDEETLTIVPGEQVRNELGDG